MNTRRHTALLLTLAAAMSLPAAAQAAKGPGDVPESKQQRDARMGWWREAKFGMFIHWGLYAVPAGTYDGKQIGGIGEWIMNRGKIPVARYAAYAKQFNPVKFNAEEWVKIAKDAGMKYIVITSKHHDGFAMFHSQASKYNIYDATPFHRDPLAELAAACKKEGLKLGFYYSQAQDWHHPGGAAHSKGKQGGAKQEGHWDRAQDGSMDQYIDRVAVPQVREILTQYGDFPAVIWWDTPKDMNGPRAEKLYKLTKELRPNIIMNNRLGGGFRGDTETPEQRIPAGGFKERDWETCMTLNDTWGFKSYDHHWKTTETLLFNLVDIVSKGGNYLLNVGPTAEGLIPSASVERLAEIGRWMGVNGEAIYGAHPSCFGVEYGQATKTKDGYGNVRATNAARQWRCTTKPGKIYVHVFQWPGKTLTLPAVKGTITKAVMLADKDNALTVTQDKDKVTIALPAAAPDKICSVVCLDVTGQ
jgi:alpha-L-fucosidase